MLHSKMQKMCDEYTEFLRPNNKIHRNFQTETAVDFVIYDSINLLLTSSFGFQFAA